MMDFLQQPLVKAAIEGALVGGAADIVAFRGFKSLHEAMAYSWGIAGWRWFQGAVVGVGTYYGLSAFLG